MIIITNLTDFKQALRDNFKGVSNTDYISKSILWHLELGYITKEEAEELRKEFQRGFPDISAIFIEKQEENNSLLVKRFH